MPAQRHPRANETMCVMNETPGMNAIAMQVIRKIIVEELLHHAFFSDGDLYPTMAKRKLDAPTGSADEKNHAMVPHINGTAMSVHVYLFSFLNTAHMDRQLTARWNKLA